MRLESVGILLDIRPFGDRDLVARIFTREHGVMGGMLRGGAVARRRPMPAQVGNAMWAARLDSQLGVFKWDIAQNMAAPVMANPGALARLNAAMGLLAALLPEREKYDRLYDETIIMMSQLAGDDAHTAYINWEMILLREIGYALDLSRCAGCGTATDLIYVSPRTGRAVCASCGAPYAERLGRLPMNTGTLASMLEHVCAAQGIQMPIARKLLSRIP